MTKLRLAAVTMAAAVSLMGATESHALLKYQTGTERTVLGRFFVGPQDNLFSVDIEATITETVAGALTEGPSQVATAQACVTVDPPGTERASRTVCGPATVDIQHSLEAASVEGVIDGITFRMSFLADAAPTLSVDDPRVIQTSAGFARTGSATASLVGGVLGEAQTLGSSWYAEAKEKVKTSATAE